MGRSASVLQLVFILAALAVPVGYREHPARSAGSAQADREAWPVMQPATPDLAMGENRLQDPGFEQGGVQGLDWWHAYVDGYEVDAGRTGGQALLLANEPATAAHGAFQVIQLDQTAPWPIYLAGWSRAQAITGTLDANYSVYLDLRYVDGTPLYGQRLDFDTGSHGWQFRERFIVPAKPVQSINVYCLLRYTHAGSAWFDDLQVREVYAELADFDGAAMALLPPPGDLDTGASVSLATRDGLGITLGPGGTVTGLRLGDLTPNDPARAHLGGLLLRDAAAAGDVYHLGGLLAQADGAVTQTGDVPALQLSASATLTAAEDHLTWHAVITDTRGADRAVTMYLALPLTTTNLVWFQDMRTQAPASGRLELANTGSLRGLGATGATSRFPWAAVGVAGQGLALAVPLDQPRVMRLVQNPVTGQLYAAFDVGLSPDTRFPGRAWADVELYRFDADWGFRAAAQGYYDRHPGWFAGRIPHEREGLWVAFSNLAPIPAISDFGIAIHELGGLNQVAFDDTAGIASFRYIAEPWSHWLAIGDDSVDPSDYDAALGYLRSRAQAGDQRSVATLTSGFFDDEGRYLYSSTVAPWCSGIGGCAVFTVNPDPDVPFAEGEINKGRMEWNDAARATYADMGLDGEYIDSYLGQAAVLDLRRAHFSAADVPLTFRTSDRQVGTPEIFATTEFARWVTTEVHEQLRKWTMANGMLLNVPWGAELFDFMGTETNWMSGGVFTPERDDVLLYRRALSYRRPYGMLMNTDFDAFGHDLVERYMQVSLFYDLYPSLFSHNASSDRYWDDPALYERDRGLFLRYVPMVRALSAAGWQPVTRARSSNQSVLVERYGQWPRLYVALRNTATEAVTTTLTLERSALGMPVGTLQAVGLLGGEAVGARPGADNATALMDISLEPQAVEVLQFGGGACFLPITAP